MTDHAPMPAFDKLIAFKLATGPFLPVFHEGNTFTFDGLIQQGIQRAERRAETAAHARR